MTDAKEKEVHMPMEICDKTGKTRTSFLELQEVNNISMAAYKEIMKIAFEAKTWVTGAPAVGAVEEFQKMFHSPPLSGRRVDCSIENAVIPIAPEDLVHIMLNADAWASVLSQIVYRASTDVPPVQVVNVDDGVAKLFMMNAELQLPSPFVQTRKFCFFRFCREIIRNIWAVIDVSNNYFPQISTDFAADRKCTRRPSGVIIRSYDNYSQVIWIENMEVLECPQNNIYSGMISANVAFSAKHWVHALIWRLNRNTTSKFINMRIQVDQNVHSNILNLTESMRRAYQDVVNGNPDERKWDTSLIQDIRILRKKAGHADMLRSNDYIAVTSFRVDAEPRVVFDFLVKKNMEMLCSSSSCLEGVEEVIKLVSCDCSNCITIHKKGLEYLFQEASRDGFCNFAVSMPMDQFAVKAALHFGRWSDDLLRSSGFAIMPDDSHGVNVDASLVTISLWQLDVPEDKAIEYMHNLIDTIIEEIHKRIKGKTSSN